MNALRKLGPVSDFPPPFSGQIFPTTFDLDLGLKINASVCCLEQSTGPAPGTGCGCGNCPCGRILGASRVSGTGQQLKEVMMVPFGMVMGTLDPVLRPISIPGLTPGKGSFLAARLKAEWPC